VGCREKQIGGSGGSLEPLGLFLRTFIPFIWRIMSAFLRTRLNPLAERTCFSVPLFLRRQCDRTPGGLRGSIAGLFLMGAGGILRWTLQSF
jgi:hypothetical protein